MKNMILISLFLFGFVLFGNSQPQKCKVEPVFTIVEDMPEFPGGQDSLRLYIAKTVMYPGVAAEKGVQGKVYVTFVVGKDGCVKDCKIARGVHKSLNKEALRVVNSLPRWTAGKQRGKPVNVSYTVPISFKLQ